MKDKKILGKIQEFRPKDLKRVIKNATRKEGFPPTLKDIKNIAENTIKNVPKYIPNKGRQKKAIEDAEKTITDVKKIQEKRKESKS